MRKHIHPPRLAQVAALIRCRSEVVPKVGINSACRNSHITFEQVVLDEPRRFRIVASTYALKQILFKATYIKH